MTSPRWFVRAPDPRPQRAVIADTVCELLRYVVAGALLAWRLS